jgi:hypothetical protein
LSNDMKRLKRFFREVEQRFKCAAAILAHGCPNVPEQPQKDARADEIGQNKQANKSNIRALKANGGWNQLLDALNRAGINTEKALTTTLNIEATRVWVTVDYVIEDKDLGYMGNALKEFELKEK